MAIDAERTEPRSRRAILAGAIGGVAAVVGSRFASPDRARAAAGDPLLIGNTTNNAGTANTTLTTSSTGTGLLITQNGTGTALRGSAVGPGSIAGFFTANNGTGISGVTGAPGSYGVFAQNNGAHGSAGALRAAGGNNHGIVATTAYPNAYAITATNTSVGVAIRAQSLGTSGSFGIGVQGGTEGEYGTGVTGYANSAGPGNAGARANGVSGSSITPFGNGVMGQTNQADGRGVSGVNSAEHATAIHGVNTSGGLGLVAGSGVVGLSGGGDQTFVHPSGNFWDGGGEFVGPNGILAATNVDLGNAVTGIANVPFGTAIWGESDQGLAGYFAGDVEVTGDLNVAGTLTKGGGTFTIDHPLDPARKILAHSFVESPDMMNVYNGNVTTDAKGDATIKLPAYFGALNSDLRYQLTTIGAKAQAWVSAKVANNEFKIKTDQPNIEVSWQVTGIRQDAWAKAHRVVVEATKPKAQQGLYIHPTEHGQPASKGVAGQRKASQQSK